MGKVKDNCINSSLSNVCCFYFDIFSRVLRRSIHNARLYKKNKRKPASEQYCMFYNRFGKLLFCYENSGTYM